MLAFLLRLWIPQPIPTPGDICTRAEGWSGVLSSEDDDANPVVLVCDLEHLDELMLHILSERVITNSQ